MKDDDVDDDFFRTAAVNINPEVKEEIIIDDDDVQKAKRVRTSDDIMDDARRSGETVPVIEVVVPGDVYSGTKIIDGREVASKELIKSFVNGEFDDNPKCAWKFGGKDKNSLSGRYICHDTDGLVEVDAVYDKDESGDTTLARFMFRSDNGGFKDRITRAVGVLTGEFQGHGKTLEPQANVDLDDFVTSENFRISTVVAYEEMRDELSGVYDKSDLFDLVLYYDNRVVHDKHYPVPERFFVLRAVDKYDMSERDAKEVWNILGKINWQ